MGNGARHHLTAVAHTGTGHTTQAHPVEPTETSWLWRSRDGQHELVFNEHDGLWEHHTAGGIEACFARTLNEGINYLRQRGVIADEAS